ncbi:MAG: CDP-diacylglycerol--glycerol-3-phosphate 3-phosphatidyltransferase [Elusimicrobiota bacterium]|jgi:CDP-diacylglycerol--glycerol-3-phosphate 3-phosphatidyltransferase|nr:CDP-diacylglycerol--glycerol-3-phosphate 3-phosphatidyltransferase [Elusimicrobiota bacterium]
MNAKMKMTLANKITLARAGLAIIMFLLMISANGFALIVSSLLFAVAAITDWVDGHIARSTNTYTPFGAIVDPFVDKILVGAAFFAFTGITDLNVPVWAVFFVIMRELAVSTLRILAALNNHVLAAERWGKFKTTVQLSAIGVIFFIIDVQVLIPFTKGVLRKILVFLNITLCTLPYPITIIVAAITVFSAISYFKNNWAMLQKSWSLPVK